MKIQENKQTIERSRVVIYRQRRQQRPGKQILLQSAVKNTIVERLEERNIKPSARCTKD